MLVKTRRRGVGSCGRGWMRVLYGVGWRDCDGGICEAGPVVQIGVRVDGLVSR